MSAETGSRPARLSWLGALALLWGSNFFWIKISLRGLAPAHILFSRLALGAVVLAAFLYATGGRFPRGAGLWRHLIVAAVFANVIPYFLFAYAEQQVDSSIAGILNATTPLWTLAIAMAVRLERDLSLLKVIGIGSGFLGTLVIFQPWRFGSQVMSLGGLACLVAAACYGVSFVYMTRFLAPRGFTPLALPAGQLLASSVLAALTLPFIGRQPVQYRLDAFVAIVVLGALGTGLAYVVNYALITESGASATSVVTYLLPLVAVLLGALFLQEKVPLHVLVGAAIVLAGVAVTRRKPPVPAYQSTPP